MLRILKWFCNTVKIECTFTSEFLKRWHDTQDIAHLVYCEGSQYFQVLFYRFYIHCEGIQYYQVLVCPVYSYEESMPCKNIVYLIHCKGNKNSEGLVYLLFICKGNVITKQREREYRGPCLPYLLQREREYQGPLECCCSDTQGPKK